MVDAFHREIKLVNFPERVRRIPAGPHLLLFKERIPSQWSRFVRAINFVRTVRRAWRELRPRIVLAYDDRGCWMTGEAIRRKDQARIVSHFHELPKYGRGDGVGAWQASREFLSFRGTTEAMIQLPYGALEVNAVFSPHPDAVERMLHPEPVGVEIWQDDLPLTEDQRGTDVTEDGRLLLDRPRLYNLIRNPGFERHELTLRIHTRGFTLYKFSLVGGLRRKTTNG